MGEEEYIKERLENQIRWYSKKSQFNQKWFKTLKIVEITLASLIPLVAGLGDSLPYTTIIVGSFGVLIAISSGVSSLYKFYEHWIEYRTTAESLKHELYLFKTKCSPYDKDDALCELVARCEALISKENSRWTTLLREKKLNETKTVN